MYLSWCWLPFFFQTSANFGAKSKRTLHRADATTALLSKQAKGHEAKQQEKTIDMDIIGEALESCFSTARPANVVDIDKDDHSNPQLCAEYAQEIYRYMHKLEVSYLNFHLLLSLHNKAAKYLATYCVQLNKNRAKI